MFGANKWPTEIRIYTRRLAIVMTLYAIVLVGVIALFNRPVPPSGALAFLLALLPALPIIGVFWAIGRLIIEMTDEYQRMLLVKQVLVATGLTLSICTIWGFLQNFDQVPGTGLFYVGVLWLAMFGIAGALVRMRA